MRKVYFNDKEVLGLCKYYVHNGSQVLLMMDNGIIIKLDNKFHTWNIYENEVRFSNKNKMFHVKQLKELNKK